MQRWNPKVIQELLHHANLKWRGTPMFKAVTDEKHEAQSMGVKMLLPGIRNSVIELSGRSIPRK